MIRATTPKHMFLFETDPEEFVRILVTYQQDDRILLEKEKDDLTIEAGDDGGYVAWFRMSQEESKLFSGGKRAQVQVRVLTASGEVLASEKENISVHDVLNDKVMA